MALAGLAAAAVALSSNLIAMLAAGLTLGVGFGAVLAAGNMLIARLFPTRSAAALNGTNVFFGIGSMAGPVIAGVAGTQLGAPHAALLTGAGALLLLAPTTLGRSSDRARTPVDGQSTSAPGQAGALWLLALILAVYIGTEVGLGGWITIYLSSSTGLTTAAAALGTSGFWLALTSGRILGTALGLRLTSQTLLLATLLGLLVGAGVLVAGVGDTTWSIAGILLLGLACGPIFPTVLAVVATTTGGSSAVTARVLALGNGGGLVIPALLGVLLSQYGASAMAGFVLSAALVMLALCVATAMIGSGRLQQRRAVPLENDGCA
jgi:fucose permease